MRALSHEKNSGRLVAQSALLVAFFAGVLTTQLLTTEGARGAPGPADFSEVVARADGSVVHVTTLMDGERASHSRDDAVGAGFVLTHDGYIVTSRHILQGARQVLVTIAGRGTETAAIVGVDESTDVAVLRVASRGLAPLATGSARSLRKGAWVLAAGSPFHLPRSWSVGIVSGLGRSGIGTQLHGYEDFIQTDAASNVGNSGGPLLDASGKAVGMMTAILSRTGRSEGVGLAIPIDVVLEVAHRLRTGAPIVRPSIGVIVRERDVRGAGQAGLEITRFQPGSSGREAGLAVGDVIHAVDGTPVARVADLQRVLWARGVGRQVTIVFTRQARRYQLRVSLRQARR